MPNRFYVVDFCKHKTLSKIDKTVDLQPPFDNAANAIVGGASLGCNVPVSHKSRNTSSVLSRVNHNTGDFINTDLASADSNLITNPGETAWMQGIKTPVLTGSVSYDYPKARITTAYHVNIDGIEWMVDTNGIGLSPTLPSVPRIRFGSQLGFKRTTIVGSNQEFLSQNKVKALHHTKHYAQVASIPVESEPLGLVYDSGFGTYEWPVIPAGSLVQEIQRNDGNISSPTFYYWAVVLRMWCSYPAIIGHGTTTFTPTSGSEVNGPLQNRKYTIVSLDDITTPDYGGTIGGTFNLGPSRSGAVIYGGLHLQGNHQTEILVNGTDILPSFSPVTLPNPQKARTTSGVTLLDPDEQFNQMATFASRNIQQFHVQVRSPFNLLLGPFDTIDVGTISFFGASTPGLLYEAIMFIEIRRTI